VFTRQKLLNLVTLVRHYKSELIIHDTDQENISSDIEIGPNAATATLKPAKKISPRVIPYRNRIVEVLDFLNKKVSTYF
jgi:hypothetical protein